MFLQLKIAYYWLLQPSISMTAGCLLATAAVHRRVRRLPIGCFSCASLCQAASYWLLQLCIAVSGGLLLVTETEHCRVKQLWIGRSNSALLCYTIFY